MQGVSLRQRVQDGPLAEAMTAEALRLGSAELIGKLQGVDAFAADKVEQQTTVTSKQAENELQQAIADALSDDTVIQLFNGDWKTLDSGPDTHGTPASWARAHGGAALTGAPAWTRWRTRPPARTPAPPRTRTRTRSRIHAIPQPQSPKTGEKAKESCPLGE